MEYDITKHLDSCIGNIFKCADGNTVWEVFFETRSTKLDKFEYKTDLQMEYFGNEMSFRDITFFVTNCVLPQFEWDFSENKLVKCLNPDQ